MEQTGQTTSMTTPHIFKNGKKEEEGFYKDGAYEGLMKMYNDKGKKLSEAKFEKGILVDGTAY